MSILWTDNQRELAEVILKHRTNERSGYDLKGVQADMPKASNDTISKVAKSLRETDWIIPGKDGGHPPKESRLVAVTARQPAPIIFTIGKQDIELEAEALIQSYMLYEDIKAHCGLNQGFSSVLRDGVGLIWQFLVVNPKIEDGKVIMEVTHGGGTGHGEGENEAGK